MIFLGDVAIAPGDNFKHLGFPDSFKTQPVSPNLEGAVSKEERLPLSGLCNSPRWLDSFSGFQLGPIFLGNNHITDLPEGISTTQRHLWSSGLKSFGAGVSERDAKTPAVEDDIVCLGFGWPVIQCIPASVDSAGVNRLVGREVVRQVRHALEANPMRKVVVVFHWNYEFELYPQPGHRALAMELIDMGVQAVIGHHPHVVGPVERYRERTIAYSLGNWAFSYRRFFGGQLEFPVKSFHQIALEIGPRGDFVHKAQFEPPDTITHCGTEAVDALDFPFRPAFEGFTPAEYRNWFIKNRVKRKALPIYRTADSTIENGVFDIWVAFRQRLIALILTLGLKRRSPRSS